MKVVVPVALKKLVEVAELYIEFGPATIPAIATRLKASERDVREAVLRGQMSGLLEIRAGVVSLSNLGMRWHKGEYVLPRT